MNEEEIGRQTDRHRDRRTETVRERERVCVCVCLSVCLCVCFTRLSTFYDQCHQGPENETAGFPYREGKTKPKISATPRKKDGFQN